MRRTLQMLRLAALTSILALALATGCASLRMERDGREVDRLIAADRGEEAVLLADSAHLRARQSGNAWQQVRAGLRLARARRSAGDFAGAEELADELVRAAGAMGAAGAPLVPDAFHELAAAKTA